MGTQPSAPEERLRDSPSTLATGFVSGVTTPFVCPFYLGPVEQLSTISGVVQAVLLLSQEQFDSDFPELAAEMATAQAQASQHSCLTKRER